jgi:hypothetical protein
MLDAIPDLRPTLRAAAPDELADLFDAFDVTAVYDKPNQTLELGATVTPELVPQDKNPRPSDTRSGKSSIVGRDMDPSPTLGGYGFVEVVEIPIPHPVHEFDPRARPGDARRRVVQRHARSADRAAEALIEGQRLWLGEPLCGRQPRHELGAA